MTIGRAGIRGVILAGMALFSLAACSPDLFFKPKYDLQVAGDNKKLKTALEAFIKDRQSMIKPVKDKAEQASQEAYQENLLRADLLDKMKSEGYYDAKVRYQDAPTAWQGVYTVEPGAVYKIDKITIEHDEASEMLPALGVAPGDVLDAAKVLAAQAALYKAVYKEKCYFSLTIDNAVTLNEKNKTAEVAFVVKAGPETVFGPAIFTGNEGVRTDYLNKMVPWQEGECFRPEKIETLRAALFETGLFSAANVKLPDAPVNGRVPVPVEVKERAHRSVSIGLNYYTDEGPGLTLGWKNRNLFGSAESLDTSLTISQLIQSLSGTLTKPFFMRKDQSLSVTANLSREDTDAYDKLALESGVSIRRAFTKRLSSTTGIAFSLNRIDDKATLETTNFALISFPQSLTYDSRNEPLDPARGWLLEGTAEPFFDALGEASPFWKTTFGVRNYIRLGSKTTLAMRGKLGSILGPATTDVPATERFYSGGGGSVRGFGYQDIGPRTASGDPQGGRALAEGSAELRFRITDTIGAVAFADAGSVDENPAPNFSNMAVGAGLGLRYFTSFGPLRMDVGVPVTQKNKTADSFQLYLSIGQAF